MEALQFPRGNYYQIICKAGDQALRVQEIDSTKYEKSRVIGTQPNSQDDNQIWMIQKVDLGEDQYEFISCKTDLVFDEQSKQIRIRFGRKSKQQLFAVVQAPINTPPNSLKNGSEIKYFWIKTDKKGNQALSLQGILRYGKFDPNSIAQLFRFQRVYKNPTIQGSAVINNNYSGKALDVPAGTWKKGQKLIQWQHHNRWNQRWKFVKCGNGFVIQSVLNGLVVDIAEQKKTSGSKIIQWQKTGNTNQQWLQVPVGAIQNKTYKFRSCHEPSLFLSIKKKNVDNGGQLQVQSQENESMIWRVEGAQP